MTKSKENVHLKRLDLLEAKVRRLELANRNMRDLLDNLMPLSQWAIQEILLEQADRIEMNKRLGIK